MKKLYFISTAVLAILVLLMIAGRIMHFPDDAIRVIGILMIIDLPFVSFTAVRTRHEKDNDRKNER